MILILTLILLIYFFYLSCTESIKHEVNKRLGFWLDAILLTIIGSGKRNSKEFWKGHWLRRGG
jgi:hypothetical protein